jgi:hypothetical protein
LIKVVKEGEVEESIVFDVWRGDSLVVASLVVAGRNNTKNSFLKTAKKQLSISTSESFP